MAANSKIAKKFNLLLFFPEKTAKKSGNNRFHAKLVICSKFYNMFAIV